MSAPQVEPSGRPGRYQRSAAGLVASLVVTVVALGGLLYFMGAFRHDLEVEPERVDYLETVDSAQAAGLQPVYPPELPEGWIATGVDVVPGEDAAFGLRMLTDEERFVGIRQEDASSTTLLREWVDEETETTDGYSVPASVARPVARRWEGYTDAGGDTAYSATVGDETILVFGSAPAEDLQAIVDSLVQRPVAEATP
ncbi:DUF4245 family protein [Nocardioides sp. SYSU DS0651]|uniref:DUF4245 family protein n=1 Tax=Nocardioides sp. SYSU DS0651 TaxID=3415955 RepID=UPI003F4C8AF8